MHFSKRQLTNFILGLLIYSVLLKFFLTCFMKEQMENYLSGRSTVTQWYETPDRLQFPTVTICFEPATKLSVAQKYEFETIHEKFFKTVPNTLLTHVFDNMTYQINRDFRIITEGGELNNTSIELKEGLNDVRGLQFDLAKLRTYHFGTCYKLEPKFDIVKSKQSFAFFSFRTILNPTDVDVDKPKSLVLHFTSNQTWIGLMMTTWPQVNPETEIIDFRKEYTRLTPKVIEKRFNEGVEDGQKCLKAFFETQNCPSMCHLLSFDEPNIPACKTTKEQYCISQNWTHPRFTECFKTRVATTYRLTRIENPFHKPVNDSFTDIGIGFFSGAKEIQQEVALLTLPDLIGSIGGSLGMFFGFSISAVLFYFMENALNKLFSTTSQL